MPEPRDFQSVNHDASDREILLHRISAQIRASLELPEILQTIVQESRQFLKVDRVKIYRFAKDDSGEVITESLHPDGLPSLLGLHFPASDIPPESRRLFIKTRQRVIVDAEGGQKTCDTFNISTDQDLSWMEDIRYTPIDPCHQQYLKAMGVSSSVVIPILIHNHLWGLFVLHHSQPRTYTERELQIVQLLVDQLSIAIAQSQLLEKAQKQAENEAALNQINNILHSSLTLQEKKETALQEILKATNSDGGRLYITADNMGNSPKLYTVGLQPNIPRVEETPFWSSILTLNASEVEHPYQYDDYLPSPQDAPELQIYHIPNLKQHSHLKKLQNNFHKICSLLIIPLNYHQRCIGCLTLFRREIETEKLWAGQVNLDQRNLYPRQSFAAWKQIIQGLPEQWTPQEMKLAQSFGVHLYMSIMERRVKEMLRHQAYHDHLTGLPNRMLFNDYLSLALANSHLSRGELVAVLFLDLDGFKHINDTLGHYMGDRLLQQVAKRLVSCLDNAEAVARWGGDEFTILLYPLQNSHTAQAMAKKLIASLNVPFRCEDKELYLKGSIGMAIAPYHGDDAETLLKHADTALFEAKQQGRNTYKIYTPNLSTQSQQRLSLEHSLYKAIERSEFFVYYQPQFSLKTNQIIGLEALLRWNSPQQGWISPGRFIPLAEETGLIIPIGEWVLETVCEQLQKWQVLGLPPVQISVNLSIRQFQDKMLLNHIKYLVEQSGVNPHHLELEITESVAMQDTEYTICVLKKLREFGIQVAMDDFGTGYSSLSSLKHFPLDTLKIDKSFIQDLTLDVQNEAIVQSIIALGHGLNLSIVAEGVETQEQLESLKSFECDIIQGYLISKPIPSPKIERLLLGG